MPSTRFQRDTPPSASPPCPEAGSGQAALLQHPGQRQHSRVGSAVRTGGVPLPWESALGMSAGVWVVAVPEGLGLLREDWGLSSRG